MKLFKICAFECRDTFVVAESMSEAITTAGVGSDNIHTIKVLAHEVPLNSKGAILITV